MAPLVDVADLDTRGFNVGSVLQQAGDEATINREYSNTNKKVEENGNTQEKEINTNNMKRFSTVTQNSVMSNSQHKPSLADGQAKWAAAGGDLLFLPIDVLYNIPYYPPFYIMSLKVRFSRNLIFGFC